jgi:hypothetical protein
MRTLLNEPELFKKLMLLLEILYHLAARTEYVMLDKQSMDSNLSPAEQERLNAVTAYIVEHFQGRVRLADAAAAANLRRMRFANILKRPPAKTFVQAVNDYGLILQCSNWCIPVSRCHRLVSTVVLTTCLLFTVRSGTAPAAARSATANLREENVIALQ